MFVRLAVRCFSSLPPSVSGSYFQIFSLEPSFKIDLVELSRLYKRLQAEHHPDKHVKGSAEKQESAAKESAMLNEAYKCLRHPYTRARHLLRVREHDPNVRTMDMEFLSDMMEFNDEIEMCEDLHRLDQIRDLNEKAIALLFKQFNDLFNEGELKTAAECLAKCKFLMQTRERIEQQREFFKGGLAK